MWACARRITAAPAHEQPQTRRLALAEIEQAADPPRTGGKAVGRGRTADGAKLRTFGEWKERCGRRLATRFHYRTGIMSRVPWLPIVRTRQRRASARTIVTVLLVRELEWWDAGWD